jgi:hypothetical protein
MLAHGHAEPVRRTQRYEQRRPERTVLHQVVREHYQTVVQQAAERSEHGVGYPAYVAKEFERYLDCGQLGQGFSRLVCRQCGYERLLAFSCKGRLCPSCTGRRMDETAAKLVSHLLPHAPHRQWVLTVPWHMRLRLARNTELLSAALSAFVRTVFVWQRRRARQQGIAKPLCGAVTFVHRFNSLLRLSPHYHSFIPDGVFYQPEPGTLAFYPLPAPTDQQVHKLLWRTATRIERLMDLHDSAQLDEPDHAQCAVTDSLAEAAAPMAQARFGGGLYLPPPPKPRCAHIDGYSLHADVAVTADDRQGLERLLRYGARPVLCQHRLSVTPAGQVRYQLRKPAWGGRTCVTMDPEDFVRRLAALIPPPWLNLTRFHGVFAANSKHRKLLLPLVPPPAGSVNSRPAPQADAVDTTEQLPAAPEPMPKHLRIAWSELLRRSFGLDVLACPRCHGGRMRLVATIKDKVVIDKILHHLGWPSEPPLASPPRGPPQLELDEHGYA